ncbi:MAG: hypothetical protein K5906_00800 [Bacilli bacterium]|nr:hypothetical protein [Bacilli bacterium]
MEKLIKVLNASPINDYKIQVTHSESVELFYVLNKLETNRATNIDEVEVTIYVDVEGKRGQASFDYYPYMKEEEIKEVIAKKIYAAKFALNPFFEIPAKTDKKPLEIESNLKNYSLREASEKVVRALLKAKQYDEALFSATEIFITKKDVRILNSKGVDVSSTSYKGFIEFIPSWEKDGEEVETYNNLEFSTLDEEELTKIIDEYVLLTKARFEATKLKLDKPVKVILEGEDVYKYFNYFVSNTSYPYIYQHMNRFELGDHTQGEEISGTKLNISLIPEHEGCAASCAFDSDGVILEPIQIIKDGVAINRHGPFRFGYYLNEKNPTGQLPILKVEAGTKSFNEMKKEPYLRCVKFSSFQNEQFSGFFGGEVRLGFYFDGEKEIPVTGFSIAGNINDAKGKTILSKETQINARYVGPMYLEIKDMGIN